MAQVPFALVEWEEVEGLTETYWERNNKVKTIVFRILLLRRCHSWLRNQNSNICSLLMSLFSTTWFKVFKSELLQFVYEISPKTLNGILTGYFSCEKKTPSEFFLKIGCSLFRPPWSFASAISIDSAGKLAQDLLAIST